MPVTDFQILGDIRKTFPRENKLRGFDNFEKDQKAADLLYNEDWQNKIIRTFRNTRWNFRLFFLALDDNNISPVQFDKSDCLDVRIAAVNRYNTIQQFPYFQMIVSGMDDTITVVYTHNVTTEESYMPITGWIAAHRFFHMIDLARNGRRNSTAFITDGSVERMLKEVVGVGGIDDLLTMKSARTNSIVSRADIYAEIGTQFLLTGKITFNPTEEQELLDTHKATMERQFAQELDAAVGKIYVF